MTTLNIGDVVEVCDILESLAEIKPGQKLVFSTNSQTGKKQIFCETSASVSRTAKSLFSGVLGYIGFKDTCSRELNFLQTYMKPIQTYSDYLFSTESSLLNSGYKKKMVDTFKEKVDRAIIGLNILRDEYRDNKGKDSYVFERIEELKIIKQKFK